MLWPDKITKLNHTEFCFGIGLNVFIIAELLIAFESQKIFKDDHLLSKEEPMLVITLFQSVDEEESLPNAFW